MTSRFCWPWRGGSRKAALPDTLNQPWLATEPKDGVFQTFLSFFGVNLIETIDYLLMGTSKNRTHPIRETDLSGLQMSLMCLVRWETGFFEVPLSPWSVLYTTAPKSDKLSWIYSGPLALMEKDLLSLLLTL